jgi:hypothetical protein
MSIKTTDDSIDLYDPNDPPEVRIAGSFVPLDIVATEIDRAIEAGARRLYAAYQKYASADVAFEALGHEEIAGWLSASAEALLWSVEAP